MIFNRISELMLSIQRYDKDHFIFDPVQTRETNYRLSDALFYDHINTIYQFIKPFLDKKKSIF